MTLQDCLPYLLYQFPNEQDLVKAIRELSEKFTTDRNNIRDYLSDERLTSAYTAFYLVTNVPKFENVLKWMPSGWLQDIRSVDVQDIGAGPGTFSIAFKEWAGEEFKKAIQVESSSTMRAQARKLWDGLFPEAMMASGAVEKLPGSLMVFGHSANEMGAAKALEYVDRGLPDHLLFIEPGTKSFFPEMLSIREGLLKRGFNVLFPCPTHDQCPMEGQDKDWCHQFIQVKQEPEVERLSQILKLDRKLLPLTVHAYSKKNYERAQERIVRVHPDTKFSFEWDVCLGPHIQHYQVMKRGLSKFKLKALESVFSGDSIVSDEEKVLDQAKRVKISKINNEDQHS